MSEPYTSGQRADNGEDQVAADITVYSSGAHWPKTLDIAGRRLDLRGKRRRSNRDLRAADALPRRHPPDRWLRRRARRSPWALRNPIAVKCHRDGNDRCFSLELALDYSASQGGREKLLFISAGDNWGFPCCATANLPYSGVTVACPSGSGQCAPDCSTITQDTNSFLIGNTPFGLDFVDTQFPAPWNHKAIVALHGSYGTWAGRAPGGHRCRSCDGLASRLHHYRRRNRHWQHGRLRDGLGTTAPWRTADPRMSRCLPTADSSSPTITAARSSGSLPTSSSAETLKPWLSRPRLPA